MANYSHPKWKKRRKEILTRRGYKCENCKSKDNLQVHHKRYVKGRQLWQYPDKELQALCARCHRAEHGLEGEMKICSHRGCTSEIEPHFEYCFKHWKQDLEEREQAASLNQNKVRDLESQISRLKTRISVVNGELGKAAGGKDRKAMARQVELANQIEQMNELLSHFGSRLGELEKGETHFAQHQSITTVEEKKPKSSGFVRFLLIAATMATVCFFALSERNGIKSKSQDNKSKTSSLADPHSGHIGCYAKGCNGALKLKSGSKGKFYGCSNFPKCRVTIDHPFRCYRCKSAMELRSGSRGKFWGCSRYPSCNHTNNYR